MANEIDVAFQSTGPGWDPAELRTFLDQVGRAILDFEKVDNAWVSFLITSDEEIRALNHQYRNIDASTDVLSFPQMEPEEIAQPTDWPKPLGDVVISWETAVRQAQEYGHSLLRELAFLAVHGVLHLLGYDHTEDRERLLMREKEEAILSALGHTR